MTPAGVEALTSPQLAGKPDRPYRNRKIVLAPGHYLADPDVGLLAPDDPRVLQTLDMVRQHGGCSFDPRIVKAAHEPRWRRRARHAAPGAGRRRDAWPYSVKS